MSGEESPRPIRFTSVQNPALVEQHNQVSRLLGRLTRDEAWDQQVCANCQTAVDGAPGDPAFRDEQSRREYWITAECQSCQDVTWEALKAMEDPDVDVPDLLTQIGHTDQHSSPLPFDLFYELTDILPKQTNFFEQMIREGKAEYHIPITCDSCHTTFTAVCEGLSGTVQCPNEDCNAKIEYELNS